MKKLKAWLRPNPLTDGKPDYTAVIDTNGSLTIADIVKYLAAEGMEIKVETAIDVVSRFNRKAAELVADGFCVNTGLVYMRPMVKGAFYDRTWDPTRNVFYISMTQGTDTRRAIEDVRIEIQGEQANMMAIYTVEDRYTGKFDGSLTPGRNAELKGALLRVVGSDPAVGIVFRNIDTAAEVKLAPVDIVTNDPSRLMILVPSTLPAGTYELTITTQFTTGTKELKSPRSITYDTPITIA